MEGFEGLDRMRGTFHMRRGSHDLQAIAEQTVGDETTNLRGSLTPGLTFDQYNDHNRLALHGNILPLPELQNNNLFSNVGQKNFNFMNIQLQNAIMGGNQGFNKYPNFMMNSGADYREESDYNQLFHNIGTMGDMPKLYQAQPLTSEEHKGHFIPEDS